jgi:hypothetical protein
VSTTGRVRREGWQAGKSASCCARALLAVPQYIENKWVSSFGGGGSSVITISTIGSIILLEVAAGRSGRADILLA